MNTERTFIGYLENLDFDEGAEILAAEEYLDPNEVRRDMTSFIELLFCEAEVPYAGPILNYRYPIGGFFFKIGLPQGEVLDKYILRKLCIDEMRGIIDIKTLGSDLDYDIRTGLMIGEYDGCDPSCIIDSESDVLDFAKHVAAFYRNRRDKGLDEYYEPYVIVNRVIVRDERHEPQGMVVDGRFVGKFLIDENLDSI